LGNQLVDVDLPIVYVADSAALATTDVHGKAVAMMLPPLRTPIPAQFTLRGNVQSLTTAAARQEAARIAQAGAAAAILVSDASAEMEQGLDASAIVLSRGTYAIDSAGGPAGQYARPPNANANAGRGNGRGNAGNAAGRGRGNAVAIPTIWVRHDMLDAVRSSEAQLKAL